MSAPGAGAVADCWAKIGVGGDGTCPELAKFVHCRNCPVYSAAAVQLLERQLPDEYRQRWTEYFSLARKRDTPGKESALIFRVGREWLALPTRVFREIAEHRPVHSLPHRRQGIVLGLVNVRGELLICVSLARLLGLEQSGTTGKLRGAFDRLAVVEWEGKLLAFPVDEIYGIHRYDPKELKGAPATVANSDVTFAREMLPWEGGPVGCLNEELLFSTLNRSLA